MVTNRKFISTLSLIGCFVTASALAETLDLQDAIKRAKENSPDLQQIQAQYDSAVQKTWFAIAPSEPTLSIMENDMVDAFNLSEASSKVVQVQQTIGFPGRAFLNRSQLKDQASAILFQMRALELQVAVNVKTAYYGLQLAQKNIQLNDDTRLAYERAMEIAKRRYESGATAQVDFLNAQVALLSNENDLSDLQTAEKVARAQLNVLLKQPVESSVQVEPIKMAYYPKIDLDKAGGQMMENRNELRAAQATAMASDKAYKLAWMSLLPDFQFTLGSTQYLNPWASPFSGMPTNPDSRNPTWATQTYMAGVQITIPLWFLFNERATITGASYDRAAARRGVDIVYNQSKVALETVIDTINSSEEKITKFERRILPLSDQAFKLALIDYSSGKIDFQTLSATATVRRQARLSYATAVVNYLTTYATYGQLMGDDQL